MSPTQHRGRGVRQYEFQCTFCHKRLTHKSWKRHEETMHLPRYQWTCQLLGPRMPSMISESTELGNCVFCSAINPDDEHLRTEHNSFSCQSRPKEERTFLRKDHLREHCRSSHHAAALGDNVLELWKLEADYRHHRWTCGFCGDNLDGWDARAKHIGKHFREGRTMKEWNSEKFLESDSWMREFVELE